MIACLTLIGDLPLILRNEHHRLAFPSSPRLLDLKPRQVLGYPAHTSPLRPALRLPIDLAHCPILRNSSGKMNFLRPIKRISSMQLRPFLRSQVKTMDRAAPHPYQAVSTSIRRQDRWGVAVIADHRLLIRVRNRRPNHSRAWHRHRHSRSKEWTWISGLIFRISVSTRILWRRWLVWRRVVGRCLILLITLLEFEQCICHETFDYVLLTMLNNLVQCGCWHQGGCLCNNAARLGCQVLSPTSVSRGREWHDSRW